MWIVAYFLFSIIFSIIFLFPLLNLNFSRNFFSKNKFQTEKVISKGNKPVNKHSNKLKIAFSKTEKLSVLVVISPRHPTPGTGSWCLRDPSTPLPIHTHRYIWSDNPLATLFLSNMLCLDISWYPLFQTLYMSSSVLPGAIFSLILYNSVMWSLIKKLKIYNTNKRVDFKGIFTVLGPYHVCLSPIFFLCVRCSLNSSLLTNV